MQHVRPKDKHSVVLPSFDFWENGMQVFEGERVAIQRHRRCWWKLIELVIVVPIQVEA